MALTKVQSEMAGAGQVLQVVNATYATQASSTTTTLIDTGLTATITPKFATSKILVFVSQNGLYKSATNNYMSLALLRNSTVIDTFEVQILYSNSTAFTTTASSTNYLDSPATTSAVTYKTQFNNQTATGTVYCQISGERSTITLMEIAQ